MLTHQLTDHHKQNLVVMVFTVVFLNVAALNKTNIALCSFPNKEKKPGGLRLARMWLTLDLARNRYLDSENQGTINNSL